MALQVSITGNVIIAEGGQTTLTANVIDTDTNVAPTRSVQYEWTATEGGFVGDTNLSFVIYTSTDVDVGTNVVISCTATIPGIPAPTVGTLTLDTLDDIGIEGINVNMLVVTNTEQPAPNQNHLWNSSNILNDLATNSDNVLYTDGTDILSVLDVEWRSNNNSLLINRNATEDNVQSQFYWTDASGGLNNRLIKSIYIVTSNGDVIEFGNDRFEIAGINFAIWRINSTDTDDITAMNTIGNDESLVIGVADSVSFGFDSVSETATISVFISEGTDTDNLVLTFIYNEIINYRSSYDITANVRDSTTLAVPTGAITYAWLLQTRIGSISANNTQTITYNSPLTGDIPTIVVLSCTVTVGTDTVTEDIILRILGNLRISDASFSRRYIRPIIDKINESFLNSLLFNTMFNKIDQVNEKPLESYGIVEININVGFNNGGTIQRDSEGIITNEDSVFPSRYRAEKAQVNFSDAINGATSMDGNYTVMLQKIHEGENNKPPPSAGEEGRNFADFGVYEKTSSGFKISYQEGISVYDRDDDDVDSQEILTKVKLAWFARGW